MARAGATAVGVAWLLSDMTLVTGMTVLVKKMGADYPAVQLVFLRSLLGLLLILPLVWRDRARLRAMQDPLRNGFRVMCNAGALTANFVALGALPLAMVNAVSYLRPVVTMLLAIALLGEQVPRARWIAAAGILAGVALAVGPDLAGAGGTALPLAGLIAVTLSLGLGAMATVQTRALRSESPTVMMLFYTAGLTLLTALPAALAWQPVQTAHWPALLGIGVLAQAGQYCFLRAYRAAEASRLAPFSYSSIVFAISAGWLFFAERPSWHLLAGACVILVVLLASSRSPKPRPLT
ncbi:DMT family transporter [Oceanicola sp. S124]|uniref:DMT family transporter n=1 Tax=Oceanicola sp. S124 TaxID=1042378 RepID=UPI000255A98A|nr:DMT family transporter [Oceanicola sp. S124]